MRQGITKEVVLGAVRGRNGSVPIKGKGSGAYKSRKFTYLADKILKKSRKGGKAQKGGCRGRGKVKTIDKGKLYLNLFVAKRSITMLLLSMLRP